MPKVASTAITTPARPMPPAIMISGVKETDRAIRLTSRQAMMLLTVLGALGVLELSVLGLPVNLPLSQRFQAAHGY